MREWVLRLPTRAGDEILIVPSSAVRDRDDRQVGSILRAACAGDGATASALARFVGATEPSADVFEALEALLRSGALVLVDLPGDCGNPGSGSSTSVTSEVWEEIPWLSDIPGTDQSQELRSLSVELLDASGVPFSNQELTLRRPEGSVRIVLDGRGRWSARDIPKGKTCSLLLPPRLELTEQQLQAGSHDGSAPVVGDINVPRIDAGEVPLPHYDVHYRIVVAPPVPNRDPAVVDVQRPRVLRVEPSYLGFARGSSLLVPLDAKRSPLAALSTAIAVLGEQRERRLLVVGHSSDDGSDEFNASLAQRRAEGIRHILTGDRDAWVAQASSHGSPTDVQRLLAYLAEMHDWPTDPRRTDGVVSTDFEDAVMAFQSTYNEIYDAAIVVDGVCGEETLGALFDCQSYELHEEVMAAGGSMDQLRWFGEYGVASAAARVLSHPSLPDTASAQGQRRVDLLLVTADLTWPGPADIVGLYDVALFEPLPLRALAIGRRDLVLTVVDHYGVPVAGEPYVLKTSAENREGVTDASGLVVERGLEGKFARLWCRGVPILTVDATYESSCLLARTRPDEPPDGSSDWDDLVDEAD